MGLSVIPLFGSGVYGKSAVVTRQRRVNCYYENRPDGDKARIVIYGTPGLALKMTVGSPLNTPIRALLGPTNATLYCVTYNQFQSLTAPAIDGGAAGVAFTGPIGTIAGLASMAANPSIGQIVTVDGSAGYVFATGPQTLSSLTAAWFVPGAKSVTNVGGYFVTEIPNTNQFAVSNLNDATSGSALSFGAAAAFPDIILAVDNLAGNLITFCQQHMEFWQPIGTPPPAQPFGNLQAATNQWGLAAVFSRAHIDNAILALLQTTAGTKRVCRIDGYVVSPISEEIDYIINQPGFVTADATALAYQRDKHPFYQITFPTMGRSFLFDLSTNVPSEAQTGLTTGAFVRHVGNLSAYYNGDTLISDAANGNLYRMDDNTFTDNGTAILREVITRHTIKGYNRFRVPQLYLDMETGVGTSAGQGANPQISVECSKDNGRSWLQARLVALGAQGQFVTRVNFRRFGQGRIFTWRIRMTDPVKFVITDGAIKVKMKKGGTA